MRHHRFIQWIFIAAQGLLISATALSAPGNLQVGKKLFDKCRPCHGELGNSVTKSGNPIPLLGGQHSEYIVMALNGYAGGDRDHVGMKNRVKGLSNQQKRDIGAYLAKFELKSFPVPRSGTLSPIEMKIENCRSCHGEQGNSFSAGYPRINGQNREYLVKVLGDYKNGNRKNPTMVYVMKQISRDDLLSIAEYYSRQLDGLSSVP